MPRSPLALAALATVAVPGLDAFDVRPSTVGGPAVDAAVVVDAQGGRWVVRAPHDGAAGAALEAEVALLHTLATHVQSGALPFGVPRIAGHADLPEGGRAVVYRQLPGRPLRMDRLGPGPGLAADLGRAIAAIHELPHALIEDAGLPVYDADTYRRRRLAELDAAARTGHVPASLLRRWEQALEDVAMWRFQPTVVHGDLSIDHVLCSHDTLTAVLGWSEAKVADPAEDLAWLLVAAPQEAVDPILEAYSLRRTELSDRHLSDRALLAGEMALARWLLHGVRTDDPAVIEDATAMLRELEEHTAVADAATSAAGAGAPAAIPSSPARVELSGSDVVPVGPAPAAAGEDASALDPSTSAGHTADGGELDGPSIDAHEEGAPADVPEQERPTAS